jgi:hypothetical protein
VISVTAVLGLASTGQTAGRTSFAPRLRAEQGRFDPSGTALVLDVAQAASQTPMARVTLVAPSGQRITMPRAGTVVGDLAVQLVPTTGRNRAPVTLAGKLVARSGAASGCASAPAARLQAVLAATHGGRPKRLTLDLFVLGKPAAARLTSCLPGPAKLPGAGAVRRLAVRLARGVGSPPSSRSVWRGLFTPVGRGSAATTESRGIVLSPSFMTLTLRSGGTTVRRGATLGLAGSLSQNGSQQGIRVRLLFGPGPGSLEVVARTRTHKLGVFNVVVKAPRRPGAFLFQARAPSRPAGNGCRAKEPGAPAGCTSATIGGVSSNAIKIRVR